MNKEFVPYELAVKLKELGFDESCFTYYYEDTGKIRTGLSIHINNGWTYSGTKRLETTLAPLFQQAFRWFRDKKGLHVIYTMGDDWNNYYWQVWRNDTMTKTYVCSSDWVYETYEEAKLACLNKLIEIVQGGQDNE